MNITRKEGNVLFKDTLNTFYLRLYGITLNTFYLRLYGVTLNTFYLRLYGVKHMVKDLSDNERRNLLPPHMGYFFNITKYLAQSWLSIGV